MVVGQASPMEKHFAVPFLDNLGALLDRLQHPTDSFIHLRVPGGIATIPIFAIFHAIIVALWFFGTGDPMESRSLWQRLVGFHLVSFGGSIIIGILTGRPGGVLLTNSWIPTYWFIFILFNLPNSPALRILSPSTYKSIPLLSIAMGMFVSTVDAISRTFAIAGTIEGLRNSSDPQIHQLGQSMPALLLLGSMAAMGGGLLDGLLNLRRKNWQLVTPGYLTNPSEGYAFRWCAICAAIYLTLTDVNISSYFGHLAEAFHLGPVAWFIGPKAVHLKDSVKWVAPYTPSEAKTLICSILILAVAWKNVGQAVVSPPVPAVATASNAKKTK